MPERLIMEAITPDPGSFDTGMMASGKPGLPRRFTWRDTTYHVEEILGTWKETTPDRGDIYAQTALELLDAQVAVRLIST